MRKFVSICLIAASSAVFASGTVQLDMARRALGDGLWSVAVKVASKAAAEAGDKKTRNEARLVELEALSGAGQAHEILKRLDVWEDADDERFRYWQAWASVECGGYGIARHLLATPFKDKKLNSLALRLSARSAIKLNDRSAAEELFSRAAESFAQDAVARSENACAWSTAREEFGDVAGAIKVLKQQNAADAPGEAGDNARLLNAHLLLRSGKSEEGQADLESIVSRGTNTEMRAFVLASCLLSDLHFANGDTNAAIRVAENAVARAHRPDLERKAGWTLGFVLLSNPSTREKGHKMISALVRKYPSEKDSGVAQLRLADGLLAAGDVVSAAREYEILLQAYPEHTLNAHVLEGRAIAFARMSRHAEAVGMFARAAQIATNENVRARCVFAQAESLFADGRFEEAAKVYGTVEKSIIQDEAKFRQAESLRRANRLNEASALFRDIVKSGSGQAVEAVLRVAALEAGRGRLEQAVTDYGMLLVPGGVLTPNAEQRVRALSGRGRALYRAYRFSEAAVDFSDVAKLQPSRRAEMGFLSALCLYGDGRDREAYASAQSLAGSIADSQLKCDLQFWIARYEAERREWTRAIAGFEGCSTNSYASVSRKLDSLVRAARCAAAASDFPKVVELTGRVATNALSGVTFVAEALVLQGEALKELARFDEAVLVFERAGRLECGEALKQRAEISRADCLFAMGADNAKFYERALEAYRNLLQGERMNASARLALSFKVGRTCEKMRRYEEAAEEYYTNVVLAYWNSVSSDEGATPKVLFDSTARAFFQRAAIILADYYESRGELQPAIRMLEYLVAARVPAADEAGKRIQRMKEKGGF